MIHPSVVPLGRKFPVNFEFHFPLSEWAKGTDLMGDILAQIHQRTHTFKELYKLMRQKILFPKPTLSTHQTFTFWVEESVREKILSLPGVFGGSPININKERIPDSSSYRSKKQSPRPRRVLLDIGVDQPEIVKKLREMGLEVARVWDHVADLVQYEIIEICTNQYVDLVATTNDRLLTGSEEWLHYLMPHRTRLCIIHPNLINDPEALTHSIYHRTYMKRKVKTPNRPIKLNSYRYQTKLR